MAFDCVCTPVNNVGREVYNNVGNGVGNDLCNNVGYGVGNDLCNNVGNGVGNVMQLCIPICEENVNIRGQPKPKVCTPKLPKPQIDLCAILERSNTGASSKTGEQHGHDDFRCHYEGERRQNLINKLRMYLDGFDDRPVIKTSGGGGGGGGGHGRGGGQGQTGFGPMIKYPGYVNYDHPFFSCPYNKLPCLASTVRFTGGSNPCSPYTLCPESEFRACKETGGTGVTGAKDVGGMGGMGGMGGSKGDHLCHCAQRRGEEPLCPAAGFTGRGRTSGYGRSGTAQGPPTSSGRYCCIPLPDGC